MFVPFQKHKTALPGSLMLGFTKVGFQELENSKGCCNTHVNQHVAGWKYPSISPTKVRNKNKTDMDQISNGRTVPFYGPGRKNLSIYLIALATVSGVRWDLVPFNGFMVACFFQCQHLWQKGRLGITIGSCATIKVKIHIERNKCWMWKRGNS